ncbi:MAG: hypothetical protein J5840_00890 [Lachnospiraceae bacterium]|nr:hypothetical protein [Lachnospiraceae bacterium]
MKKPFCIFVVSLTVLNFAACNLTNGPKVENLPTDKESTENYHAELPSDNTDITVSDDTTGTTDSIETDIPKDYSFYEGEWQRTDVHSSLCGSFAISNADEEGFDFEGEFYFYANSGNSAGRAVFTSDNEAVYEDINDFGNGKIYFSFEEDMLNVTKDGFVSGMGMNVFVIGLYTKGEPEYTNANVFEETFSEEELEVMKDLLGEDYEELFVNDTECGAVTTEEIVLTDSRNARMIRSVIPGMYGFMGYRMIIAEDGMIYFLHDRGTFVTNDPECEDEYFMMDLLGEENLG